jgi:hypothetical protein
LKRALDLGASLADFGPSDGDPVILAAHAAAGLLRGEVSYVRPPPDDPPGTVY